MLLLLTMSTPVWPKPTTLSDHIADGSGRTMISGLMSNSRVQNSNQKIWFIRLRDMDIVPVTHQEAGTISYALSETHCSYAKKRSWPKHCRFAVMLHLGDWGLPPGCPAHGRHENCKDGFLQYSQKADGARSIGRPRMYSKTHWNTTSKSPKFFRSNSTCLHNSWHFYCPTLV